MGWIRVKEAEGVQQRCETDENRGSGHNGEPSPLQLDTDGFSIRWCPDVPSEVLDVFLVHLLGVLLTQPHVMLSPVLIWPRLFHPASGGDNTNQSGVL